MTNRRKGQFEIRRERTDAHDHFMCADYEWSVIDIRTGDCVASFDEAFEGEMSGVADIAFSPNGRELIVTDHDGTVTRRELP